MVIITFLATFCKQLLFFLYFFLAFICVIEKFSPLFVMYVYVVVVVVNENVNFCQNYQPLLLLNASLLFSWGFCVVVVVLIVIVIVAVVFGIRYLVSGNLCQLWFYGQFIAYNRIIFYCCSNTWNETAKWYFHIISIVIFLSYFSFIIFNFFFYCVALGAIR